MRQSYTSSYFSEEGCPSHLSYTSVLADCDSGGAVPYHQCSMRQRQRDPKEQNEGCCQPSASSLQVGVGPFELL